MTSNKSTFKHHAVLEGVVFDLGQYAANPLAAECAIKALESFRSKNEYIPSRIKSNRSFFSVLKLFIAFIDLNVREGRNAGIDLRTFRDYMSYLDQRYSKITCITAHNVAARVSRYAMKEGLIPTFPIPSTMSRAEAYTFTKRQRTYSDYIETTDTSLSPNDLNRAVATALKEFCWQSGLRLHHNILQGHRLLLQVVEEGSSQTLYSHDSREDLIKSAFAYSLDRERLTSGKYKSVYGAINRYRFWVYAKRNAVLIKRAGLSRDLLAEYIYPGTRTGAFFMPLFALMRLNPDSITGLTLDMLVDALKGGDGSQKKIRWRKGRAHAELLTEAIPTANPRSRNLARAWNMLREIGDLIRHDAIAEEKGRLFLHYHAYSKTPERTGALPITQQSAMITLHSAIAQDTNPQFDLLRKMTKMITLKMIRETSGSIIWHDEGPADAQRGFRHKSRKTTDIYTLDSRAKAKLDTEIERGQAWLLEHFLRPIHLVPNDPLSIVEASNLTTDQAQALVADEYNNGLGVSLVNGNAFVVDTPLNCLRMQTWLKVMIDAEQRLKEENIERWEKFWIMQITIFQDAIADFPRRTQAAARALGEQTKLVFPEPH